MINEEIGSQLHSANSMDLPPARTQTSCSSLMTVVYTIEFQKRGLPHAHILLWLHPANKFPTPDSEAQLQIVATPLDMKPSQTKLLKIPTATLNELIYFEDPETEEDFHFICEVKIIGIDDNQKWRYTGCPFCFKKALPSASIFWCRQCDKEVMAELRYRLTVEVQDSSAISTFVIFGKEVESLVMVSAQEVVKTLHKENGREVFPDILRTIIGKVIKVQIKLTKYNYAGGNEGFTVTKLIEQISTDEKLDDTMIIIEDSQQLPQINENEECPPPTPTPIAVVKPVFTPMTNNILTPKVEKDFKCAPLRMIGLDEEADNCNIQTVKISEDNKRKRMSRLGGKEN